VNVVPYATQAAHPGMAQTLISAFQQGQQVSLIAVPALAWSFWRYERRLGSRGGAPLLDPAALRAPGLGRALLLYAIGAFFLLFSVYLQNALHVDALSAGLVFLPFGVGFLLGPLSTPFCTRLIGAYVNPFGMGLEVVGLVGLAWLIDATPVGMPLASVPLAAAPFVIGFGQGLALPTLMRMVTGRVAPALSGMIADIASSTLQVSTWLSVAIIGGIFYTVLGTRQDPAAIAHAFIVALLSISFFLAAGAALGISLARPPRRPRCGRPPGRSSPLNAIGRRRAPVAFGMISPEDIAVGLSHSKRVKERRFYPKNGS